MRRPGKRGWATYAFCVLRRLAPPSVDEAPRALPGFRRLRGIDIGPSMWLIVADAPRSKYSEELIEQGLRDLEWVSHCALAHERIIESFMDQGTVVPLKLFSLFDDDARTLSYFEGVRDELEAVLERVDGCEEWGLRVSLEPGEKKVARRVAAARVHGENGSSYLRRKKVVRDDRRERRRDVQEQAEALYARLVERAAASCRRVALEAEPGSRVVLDAAFLVPALEADRFEEEVQTLSEELHDTGIAVQLSGPWPPYHFVEENL